ncbi:hypothetical protein MNU22_11935 [Pseudomonas aeruginosa]|nr:hypothetical protein [Pseudomonas aeruginosa]
MDCVLRQGFVGEPSVGTGATAWRLVLKSSGGSTDNPCTQAGAGSDGVALRQERDEESWLEEEYRRRQRRQGGEAHARSDEGDEAPADEAGESAQADELPRKGQLIDIEV